MTRRLTRSRLSEHQRKIRGNALRASVFVTVTLMLASIIALTFDRAEVGPHQTYKATFADVSGLTQGSDVRAAGVSVGRINQLQLQSGNQVVVTFSVSDAVPLTSGTRAQVRYANLTGDRYLELTQGLGQALPGGATLPVTNTAPALDLDTLFNGFRPLTQALDPEQVNQLTSSLIAVSQGEGSALQGLLARVGSLTGGLANHDQLIGQVINNLSSVLTTVDSHSADLGSLINGLQQLTAGLARDRGVIATSLVGIDQLASETNQLLVQIRPDLKADLIDAARMSKTINDNSAFAAHYLSLTPSLINAMGRAGAYGSYFNFYLCAVRFKISTPAGAQYTPFTFDSEKRCKG